MSGDQSLTLALCILSCPLPGARPSGPNQPAANTDSTALPTKLRKETEEICDGLESNPLKFPRKFS